ncbi:MAG TPA: alpha/beta fold hydrolase [Bryobacteraceae bacterium]|nr:alpha/beta fold hydrolase [Bryobacteraceae bacterium]
MTKPALLLLPGFLCDETVWRDQLAAFESDFDCSIASYAMLDSLPAMAAHALKTAPSAFALAGHSMGGRVALEVFRLAPERITHIALFDTGCEALPAGEPAKAERRARQRLLDIARSEGMRAMSYEWIPPMIHPDRWQDNELIEEIVRMMERSAPDRFEAQMNALLSRPRATDLLARISVPALVLTGQDDGWSPPERHREIAAAIPGATLSIIPECGHMSTMERPSEVTRAMYAWLSR